MVISRIQPYVNEVLTYYKTLRILLRKIQGINGDQAGSDASPGVTTSRRL